MKALRAILLVAGVLSGLAAVWRPLAGLLFHIRFREAGAIGVIGGADGPTAIYVANGLRLSPLIPAGLCAVFLTAWVFLRRRKGG